MPKKKKKRSSKSLKKNMNYEISNEFDMNNGPNEISSKNNKNSFRKRSCK